jgi:hypothetical protein
MSSGVGKMEMGKLGTYTKALSKTFFLSLVMEFFTGI